MKLETRIKEKDGKLVIVLPKFLVNKGDIKVGDVLDIELRDTNLTINNRSKAYLSLDKIDKEDENDIFSKTLLKEELILAK